MKKSKPKILLVDAQTLFAQVLIKTMSDFDMSHAKDGNQMRLQLMLDTPQLIILDLQLMDGSDVFQLMDEILNQGLRILVLASNASDAQVRACYYLGVHGFLKKSGTEVEMMMAIQIVLHGGLFFPAHILEKVRDIRAEALPEMRVTELAVLDLLCAEDDIPSNSQIAATIFLSLQHVKNLTGNLFTAFKIRTRHGLVQEAKRRGFVSGVKLRRYTTKGRRKYLLAAGQRVYQHQPEK